MRRLDPKNLEAQAARIYWKALFGEHDFQRYGEEDGINPCLDYRYAVLRGVVSCALCGAGLNPTLGIHHHNRYNPFCLADDLMEGGNTYFIHSDWLGTERARTTATGAVYETCTSLPFGDWLSCAGTDVRAGGPGAMG